LRIDPERHLQQLLQPIFDPAEKKKAETAGRLLARGLAAGPGAASGMIVFSAEEAEEMAKHGHDILLVRIETSPEDIRGMAVSKGILTARGGATSHAALVARQMGKVCVSGCQALELDYSTKQLRIKDRILKQGDWLSLDGFEGKVYDGKIKTKASEVVQVLLEKSLRPEDAPLYRLYEKLMRWASEARRLEVWTNADQPEQAVAAVAFGAQGIGLCRTEHMFFEGDRIDSVREMILATDRAGREAALAKLAPLQEEDFVGLFRALGRAQGDDPFVGSAAA
jgi:pyruvate,orthophosphate dikinase